MRTSLQMIQRLGHLLASRRRLLSPRHFLLPILNQQLHGKSPIPSKAEESKAEESKAEESKDFLMNPVHSLLVVISVAINSEHTISVDTPLTSKSESADDPEIAEEEEALPYSLCFCSDSSHPIAPKDVVKEPQSDADSSLGLGDP